jgi:hypothetical protein
VAANRYTHPESPPLPVPLSMVIYAIAQEGSDEEAGGTSDDLWAGLLRDGPDIADRARDLVQTEDADSEQEEIDESTWAQLEKSAGVIVTRDIRGGVSVQTFRSEEDLMSAWNALEAELKPSESGSVVRTPESDDTPT